MAPHSSTLAWKIPWAEEPGRLHSMESLRVGHNWVTSLSLFTFMHWRRKWKSTPVFLPGESQGWGSLVGCRLWGRRVRHDWSDLAVAVAAHEAPTYWAFLFSNLLQMPNDHTMVNIEFFGNLCSFKRISFDDCSQLAIVNFWWLATGLLIFKALVFFAKLLEPPLHCYIC